MGAKQSSTPPPRVRSYSHGGQGSGSGDVGGLSYYRGPSTSNGASRLDPRTRTRSVGNVTNGMHGHALNIPPGLTGTGQDSDSSTPEEHSGPFRFMQARSLPVHLFNAFQGFKCPVCSKVIAHDDIECHLVMCLTKPRIDYNEDVLSEDKGECVICFDELTQGDTIARLPCLCIYHKSCIDSWFQVNRSCPEHPSD